MKKLVAIIAGDPESINSEIIAKTWFKRGKFKNLNIFVIGNYNLIKRQLISLNLKIKINKITSLNDNNIGKKLSIYDIPLSFKNPFKISKLNKKNYIFKSFNVGIKFAKKKQILGLINCPINKKEIFEKNIGITEFLAKKTNVLGNEAMLIYNKKLSVCPITTHIKLKNISKNLTQKKIFNKISTINKFYYKNFKSKPKIAVTGLNPHNDELRKDSEEKTIIMPAIKKLKKKGLKVEGPLPADTAFLKINKKKFNILVGMYHDQVLSPFKGIYNFNAINITLGLPFIRISPDHGTGRDIIRKKLANPLSLIECIKFFNRINVKT